MAADAKSPNPAATGESFGARLKAWWDGRPAGAAPPADPDRRVQAACEAVDAGPRPGERPGWSAERITAATRIFGPATTFPGGQDSVRNLVVPLGLTERHGVIEYGSGLGVGARLMAREFKTYVDAFENDPALADEHDRLNRTAQFGRHVTLHRDGIAAAQLKPESRDAALMREALSHETDKRSVMTGLMRMLRPGGQLVLVELVRNVASRSTADIEELNRPEHRRFALERPGDIKDLLVGLGFDVRIVEDITRDQVVALRTALTGLAGSLKAKRVPGDQRDWLIWEAEYWARRTTVLEGGDVGLYRFYARLPETDPFAKRLK